MQREQEGHHTEVDEVKKMNLSDVEIIRELIDIALLVPQHNRDELVKSLAEIFQAIEISILKCGKFGYSQQKVELYFLLGYSWYLHPARVESSQVYENVENALFSVLEIEPAHALAWLYLGYNAYDMGYYIEAQFRFERVQMNQLSPFFRLKALEIQLCCCIRLSGLSEAADKMKEFVVELEEHPIEDIFPIELARTLESVDKLEGLYDSELQTLALRIDRAGGFTNWFTELV